MDAFEIVAGLFNLLGDAARALVATRGGRSLLLMALAALPIILVATAHR